LLKFPHEFQLDAKDCGPACIKIVAKYFGQYYSLQYLRDICGISREGISFLDMSVAAEQIGLRSKCIKVDWIDLQRIPLPCVVHWRNSHFIVLYKITKSQVFVSDPAKGLLKYSIDEFKKGWLGDNLKWAVLVVEPTSDFKLRAIKNKSERKKTVENIIGYFYPFKKALINLLIVMLIVTILQALLPFISRAIIDVGIQTHALDFINMVLIGNVAIIISVLLSNMVRDWILLHISSRLNISLVSDYLIKLMKLPVTFFESKLTGDILQRASDHDRIRNFILNNSLNFLFSILTFLVFSGDSGDTDHLIPEQIDHFFRLKKTR
jgi:ATP-binding cassette subfamily B protein